MTKSRRFLFITVIVTAVFLVIGNLAVPAGASKPMIAATNTPTPQLDSLEGVIDSTVPEEIKRVIQSYFEIRYRTLSTLQLESFGDLVSDTSAARAWVDTELSKLAVEVKHAKLHQLKYMDYKYFLDFESIAIDTPSTSYQTATISVVEGHEVVY